MADISKIKLPDETEVNLKDAQAFANIENDGQGGSSYTITRRDGTTKQVTIPNVTTTDPGLMTASDKIKIDTIEQGAEVNQQAFSKIRITKGSAHTDLDADTKTDTLELIEGDNITLTPSAVSDAVTIHAKDTVYTLAQDATDGHIIILTNNDEGSTDHVQTITIPDNNTTYTVSLDSITNEIILKDSFGNTTKAKPNNASASLDGFMSKSDKSKLDGIASGAEVNQNAFSNVKVDDTTISADSKTDTLTFIAGSNITITPNATNDSITISSSYTNTTYELAQDATDGHKFTLSGSNGYTKTITIPDNNTTYTLSVGTGTDANQIVFTPSSGSATKITAPYATKALKDADGNVIKDTYAASFSISDHTITLKNKSGVSLGTVTVPDNNTTYTFAEGTTNKAFSVTPSGGSAQTVPIHGLGSASEKNFTTSVTSGSADLVTSGAVASAISTAIDNLPEPMIFKGTLGTNGTITSLPTALSSNEGWTYKVITAGTYASQAAKVGDMFVSAKIGSAYQWVYVPSGDDVEDTWRNIKVNGTEKLGTGISSGAVDFVDGDFINITYANNKITVSHADTSSQASVSNSGRTYIQSVTLDGAGHVTKLTSATETVVNTDRYVNSASFADDTTASANSPVKMTLTRAGNDTATVTANIPKVSASSAGVAPKGATVSSQSQSTKFLREDGTWSAPSYTVNTDTKVTSVGNHYSPSADSSAQLSASATGATAAWSIDVVKAVQLQRDAKGHVVGVTVTSGKIPGNPNTNYYHKTGSWNGLTYTAGKVGSPDDLAFTIPTGTSATTVAVGNHTHSTTIATSTGTNQLTLSHGGKYAITTGGTSFVFTMPTDNNTDTNVTQTATNTNANYEVLFSGTADNTTRTEGARKYSNLTFNPSTGTLTTTKVVSANATLGVADIDTANITEDNVGNLIVTGAARFLNTINGSISGNAATASDSAKLNGYASDTSATNNTIARRTANGYIFATYFNQSSGAETPTSSSYIIYANSDGYFRKSTVANMKTAMSLNNVENKSSATIRGELTSANVTTALGYTPVNKAGDTITGALKFGTNAIPEFSGSPPYILGIEAFANGGDVKWKAASSVSVGYATTAGSATDNTKVAKAGDTMSGTLNFTTTSGISYQGTKATYTMIAFKDNTNDNYGNGIVIGGGGLTVVGGGESAGTVAAQYSSGGDEILELVSDGNVYVRTNVQSGYASAKTFTFSTDGSLTATKFIGPLQGNADTATKATQDESGNNIKASYASSFSISDHTITLKNKNGASLGTVTVPDNNTTYSAGTGLALSGTTFRTTVPRVAKDSHSLPGQNTCVVEEYTNGTNYNLPSNHYYHIYSSQGSDVNYGCQLALGMTTAGVYYREYNNKTWGSWRSLIDTDANTHRPIQMNGTEILGNNTTALNLKAGTNVSLSNSSGTVTITATDTTYSAGTGLTLSGTQFSVSAANASTIMNLLTTGSSAPTDNDYYIAQYAGGGTSTTTYHRRPHSALWSYIKSKADSTYLASTTKYAGSSSVGGAANSANQLNDDTSYINSGTSYVTHTTASTLRPFLTRFNNVGIGTESHGCLVLSNNWSSNVYNAELLLGMGDRPYIYFRGKNNGTYTTWLPVGKFSAVPTTGQVVITDGTEGGIKSSGYTIAKSVPSNAVFTDTNYYHTTGSWSGLTYTATANGGAGALAFTIPTGTSATTVAVGNHTHGLLNNDFTVGLANTTEDSGWSMINSSYNGYLLKSIRFNSSSPAWGVGSYGSGICFGGGDTKGILSVAYSSPNIKIAGGNGTKPVWWLGLTGTSGTSYNLNDITNGNARDNTKLPLAGGTLTGNLTISHATSADMSASSTNPKITFAENGAQPVHLTYTDYDNYRGPAGLKVIGGASATPAWFEVEGDIYETGTKLSAKYAPITNNAGYHNSIYRGKSLGTSITTAQWNAISAGTFDDLYIGDYWTLSTTINGTTSNINYVIAAFDYWWNCGDSYPQGSNKHHVVLVPSGYLYTAQMNTSNVTTGGYISSAMYTTNLTAARTGISTLFGDHLYSVRRLFTTAVNAVGQATGWGWYTSSVDLMNENMVYGSSVWTTSGYEVGVDRNILPLFLLNPASASIRATWWLRSVAAPAYFAFVNYVGIASCHSASNSIGVRPAFAIY